MANRYREMPVGEHWELGVGSGWELGVGSGWELGVGSGWELGVGSGWELEVGSWEFCSVVQPSNGHHRVRAQRQRGATARGR